LAPLAVLVVITGAINAIGDEEAPAETAAESPAASTSAKVAPTEQPKARDAGSANDKRRRTGTRRPADEKTQEVSPRSPQVRGQGKRQPRTVLVTRVVDGDTVELGNGESVRVVGIDTPERGECGYDEAAANLERLVLGRQVRLRVSDEDRDHYGRLLRYLDVDGLDAGLEQIKEGLAVARYDSRDGYGYHPRENRYIATDKVTPDKTCRDRKPAPLAQPVAPAAGCAPGYDPCVPPYPPDLDCADVGGPVLVTGSDPHGLDRDGDGTACE
jgi:endonuclease YncB( thermonuclease family)